LQLLASLGGGLKVLWIWAAVTSKQGDQMSLLKIAQNVA
jgi:hypothetical protein